MFNLHICNLELRNKKIYRHSKDHKTTNYLPLPSATSKGTTKSPLTLSRFGASSSIGLEHKSMHVELMSRHVASARQAPA